MECFVVFMAILITVTVMLAITSTQQAGRGSIAQTIETLAKRYGGTGVRGNLWRRHTLQFSYRESAILVEVGKNHDARFMATWPDKFINIEVFHQQSSMSTSGDATMKMIDLPDSEPFADTFTVRANNRTVAEKLLSPAVQFQIESLYHFMGDVPVHIRWNMGRLDIVKEMSLRRHDDLDEFVRQALAIFDQAMLTQTQGIEFVDSDKARPLDDAICQLCGEKIESELVYCRRCKTPHHRDCWHYNGRCTTFACGETAYLVPNASHAIPRPKFIDKPGKPR